MKKPIKIMMPERSDALGRRLDAGESIFLARQLEHVMAELYETETEMLRILSFLPVNTTIPKGADSVTYRQLTRVGAARIGSALNSEVPRVGLYMREFNSKIHQIDAAYGYSMRDLERAEFSGLPLDSESAMAARIAIDTAHDEIATRGESSTGLIGVFSHANVPTISAPNGVWGTPNAANMLADLNRIVTKQNVQTKGVHAADMLLLPQAHYLQANHTLFGDTGLSVLELFKSKHPEITVDWWTPLDGAVIQGGSATQAAFFFKRDPKVIEYIAPEMFEQIPEQHKNFETIVNCRALSGGVVIRKPLACLFMTGLGTINLDS